ncbi:hypothetical protein VDG1235_181 [Verrucomicrobiia bacterium DG1235]|nr:hypothetical protein VDG1235_181 [Verrucomicrobiae bacterium DG1235]
MEICYAILYLVSLWSHRCWDEFIPYLFFGFGQFARYDRLAARSFVFACFRALGSGGLRR